MKKTILMITLGVVVLSSCGTYAGSGAYTGGMFGSILGSAIGGISDGPRGSDIGTIVGMAGGAIIGGAIGQAQDNQRQRDLDQYRHDKAERAAARAQRQQNYAGSYSYGESSDSGFDSSNSGDDRLYDFTSSDYTGNYSAQQPETTISSRVEGLTDAYAYSPSIEVRNARFVDDNQDGSLKSGELSKIIFEIYNNGQGVARDVVPTVVETTGNKHIYISPSMHIESIKPGKGVRYTAMVKAAGKLKAGSVQFEVSVIQGNTTISKVTHFTIPTVR